jgi:hypothetical protein
MTSKLHKPDAAIAITRIGHDTQGLWAPPIISRYYQCRSSGLNESPSNQSFSSDRSSLQQQPSDLQSQGR